MFAKKGRDSYQTPAEFYGKNFNSKVKSAKDDGPLSETPKTSAALNTKLNDAGRDPEKKQEDLLESMLGIKAFGSTKGKKVPDGNVSAVDVSKARVFKQVMKKKGYKNAESES